MECCTDTAKRKKRKTRKCLDEIRKRSRRTSCAHFDIDENKSADLYSRNIQQCIITDNRLTLRMFPNVIRSKTVTRPIITLPSLHLARNSQEPDAVTSPRQRLADGHEYFGAGRHIPVNYDYENSEENKSFDMFSSVDEVSEESDGGEEAQLSARAQYEALMSEVPACLQRNTKLIREDVMKDTKALLRDLYLQSRRELSPSRCDTVAFTSAPERASSNVSDSGSASSTSSPLAIVMRDSPEYTYYPHRLN